MATKHEIVTFPIRLGLDQLAAFLDQHVAGGAVLHGVFPGQSRPSPLSPPEAVVLMVFAHQVADPAPVDHTEQPLPEAIQRLCKRGQS